MINNNFNNNFTDKIEFYIRHHVQGNEMGIDGQEDAAEDIMYFIESELLDKELIHNRWKLNVFSSPEEYWIIQGKIYLLKELKEKLHNNNNIIEEKEK